MKLIIMALILSGCSSPKPTVVEPVDLCLRTRMNCELKTEQVYGYFYDVYFSNCMKKEPACE